MKWNVTIKRRMLCVLVMAALSAQASADTSGLPVKGTPILCNPNNSLGQSYSQDERDFFDCFRDVIKNCLDPDIERNKELLKLVEDGCIVLATAAEAATHPHYIGKEMDAAEIAERAVGFNAGGSNIHIVMTTMLNQIARAESDHGPFSQSDKDQMKKEVLVHEGTHSLQFKAETWLSFASMITPLGSGLGLRSDRRVQHAYHEIAAYAQQVLEIKKGLDKAQASGSGNVNAMKARLAELCGWLRQLAHELCTHVRYGQSKNGATAGEQELAKTVDFCKNIAFLVWTGMKLLVPQMPKGSEWPSSFDTAKTDHEDIVEDMMGDPKEVEEPGAEDFLPPGG